MKMRIYFLSMLASIGLILAGCSDDLGDGLGNEVQSGDKGYVKIAINLPTTSGQVTRSQNDQFDDGLKEEYEVKNAIVAFFKGGIDESDESKATFAKAIEINLVDDPWATVEPSQGNNVTTSKSFTIDGVPTVEANEQMYAFVILNNNELFSVSNGKLLYSGTEIGSFLDLQSKSYTATETDASKFTGAGFLMSNAPISDRPSETASFSPVVTTLAEITVYDYEPDASITADPIYVERAVAKVEVNVTGSGVNNNNDGSMTLPVKLPNGTTYSNHKVRFTRWALNVTNKSSKIVRDVSGYTDWANYFNEKVSTTNRFFGTAPDPYRVYWAVDNNYDTNAKDNFNHFDGTTSTLDPDWHDMAKQEGSGWVTNIDYCFENTMAATQQIQGFTTGVLLEGSYQIGEDTNVDVFTLGASTAVYSTEEMLAYINELLGKTEEDDKYEFVAPEEGTVIGSGENESAKIASYKAAFQTGSGTQMSDDDAKVLIANATVGTINYYKGGRTYYWSRPIKHFGDYYTPIYKGDTQVDYYDSADDYDNDNHLGRYGVVRNNWYELNITSVSGPGYPEIPEIPTEPENPDDPGEGYVKMEINILSWAKREQDVEL